MPEAVRDLLLTDVAETKLGRRSISGDEVLQLRFNRSLLSRNVRLSASDERRLLIGETDGGRILTVVIERTLEPTTWIVVTAWESSAAERRLLGSR